MGCKWVRRSKILSGLNLNMVSWDPVQKQENFVFEGHRSTFWIKMQFGIGHLHLHINCSLHVWGRVQGSQIFKQNSIISIRSKVIAFLVILLSPWSPCCPHHPHVVPIIPIAPRRSPCGLHGCGLHGLLCCLRGLHPMLSPWSLWSPCCPRHPHVIPVLSLSPIHCPHSPQKVPMWSPWLWSPWSPLLSPWSPPHVVPVVPMSSLSSSCHPHVIPIVPTSLRRSQHHP